MSRLEQLIMLMFTIQLLLCCGIAVQNKRIKDLEERLP